LVVGLGNPGSRYERTRHNVGFRAVDRWVDGAGASWESAPVGKGEAATVALGGGTIRVAKPHTFMNLSGDMVQPLARYFRIEPESVLVVSDDMELPLGKLRIRGKGSAGGQNGLKSILERFGTKEVPRLRLGVGPKPQGADAASFVLGRFRPEESDAVDGMIERAVDAIAVVCAEGVEPAMNRFNGGEPA
jgi:PTH1 family peptidyl-tRNA hydrolase